MTYQTLTTSTPDGLIDINHLVNSEFIANHIGLVRGMLNSPAISWIDSDKIVLGGDEGSMIYGSAQYEENYKNRSTNALVLYVVNNPTFSTMFPNGVGVCDLKHTDSSEYTLRILPFDDISTDNIVQFDGVNFFKFDFMKRAFPHDRVHSLAYQLTQHQRLWTVEELRTMNILAAATRMLRHASIDLDGVTDDPEAIPELFEKLTHIKSCISETTELVKKLSNLSA